MTVDFSLGESPTPGADVIRGTAGDDVIIALEGNDIICGLQGDDLILAGPGDDAVFAGGGADNDGCTLTDPAGLTEVRISCGAGVFGR